jgi:hypothetical protein
MGDVAVLAVGGAENGVRGRFWLVGPQWLIIGFLGACFAGFCLIVGFASWWLLLI